MSQYANFTDRSLAEAGGLKSNYANCSMIGQKRVRSMRTCTKVVLFKQGMDKTQESWFVTKCIGVRLLRVEDQHVGSGLSGLGWTQMALSETFHLNCIPKASKM